MGAPRDLGGQTQLHRQSQGRVPQSGAEWNHERENTLPRGQGGQKLPVVCKGEPCTCSFLYYEALWDSVLVLFPLHPVFSYLASKCGITPVLSWPALLHTMFSPWLAPQPSTSPNPVVSILLELRTLLIPLGKDSLPASFHLPLQGCTELSSVLL